MKHKIYEDKLVAIFIKSKDGLEIGKEAEVSDSIFVAAMEGYKQFASHLENPQEFWKEVKFGVDQCFEDVGLEK